MKSSKRPFQRKPVSGIRTLFTLLSLLISLDLLAQAIQPLGLPIGHYEIKGNGTSFAQVYCVNAEILTTPGNVYNRVQFGNNNVKVKIGDKLHNLQQALDSRLLEIKFVEDPEFVDSRDMYIQFKNRTGLPVSIDVNDNLVLSNKIGNAPLKSIEFLNKKTEDFDISHQHMIWFSQDFKKYITENIDLLIEYGLLQNKEEQLSVNEFLKRRKDFLKANGVRYTDSRFADGFDLFGKEFALSGLLKRKNYIKGRNSGDYDRTYLIRYTDEKYFVDNGSMLPIYVVTDTYELTEKLDGSKPAYFQFDNFPSKIRENNFLSSLQIAKREPVGSNFLLYKKPLLTEITDVAQTEAMSEFHLKAETKASTYDNGIHKLTFQEKNNSFISALRSKILSFFGETGKNANQSLASILEESKQALSTEFSQTNLEVILDDRTRLTLNNKADYKKLLKYLKNFEAHEQQTVVETE